MVKIYLITPSGALSPCPLSMTDGAAFLIEFIKFHNPELYSALMEDSHKSIISTNPQEFITSGQWMTELLGGSDVRASTETIGMHYKDNEYKLYGYKWFTSAIDAKVTFALAKISDPITNKVNCYVFYY